MRTISFYFPSFHFKATDHFKATACLALLLFLLLASSPSLVSAQILVLEGGTVHSLVGEPTIGHVIIQDRRVRAVGQDATAPNGTVPSGATRVDVSGLHVYPGLFDAFGQLGLVEVNAVPATVDTTEIGAYNPHLRSTTAIHPASELIPVARANGITHSVSAPSASNSGVIPGQAGLIQLDGWTVEEMTLDPSVAMVINWPVIRTRSFDFATFTLTEASYNDAKKEADKAQGELRDWLDAARHYVQATSSNSGRTERNLKLEALARVVDGGQRVIILANTQRDIEAAIELTEQEGLDMVLAGGRDAWKVKELLAEKRIPVILGLTLSSPVEEDDPYDRPFNNAGELVEAGILISFASSAGGGGGPGGAHNVRGLPYEAAMAAAFGLSRDDALKALTLWPAEMLGVAKDLGSIEPGKIANLIVTDGHPLEITTRVHQLVIGGRVVSTENKHRGLYERYRSRPAAK